MKREDQIQLATLLTRYIQGNITAEERVELFSHAANNPELRTLLQQYSTSNAAAEDLDFLSEIDHEHEWALFHAKIQEPHKIPTFYGYQWKWVLAAASILLVIGFLMWLPSKKGQEGIVPDTRYGHKNDVLPGNNQAILTLSNGRTMTLDDSDTTLISDEHNALKIGKGSIDYTAMHAAQEQQFNTIKTPKRGTYRVVLEDGTKVWLNSETELAFPVRFTGEQRIVKLLEGEAFFEVNQMAKQPFLVQTDRFHIQVLGTSFNVNTYEKNREKTILTEGKVMVQQGNLKQVLVPGFAAICKADGLTIVEANVEEALSWKEGYFFFDGKTLQQILLELSRWYGVSVNYQTEIDQSVYQGGTKKNATLATVCKMLTDLSGRTFEIEGKTLTVK